MSLAALAKDLAAAGTPIEGIILALEAVEARDRATAEKREQAAERKRRQRDRERDSHVTVTGQSGDETPSLDKSPPDPQKLIPTPHTHGECAPTREAAPKAWACPEGVDPQHWRDFRANRRRKKLTDTETSYAGQLRLLERYADDEWPPGKLVQHAAEKGWGTIVDPSEYETPRNGKRPANDHREEPRSPMLAGLQILRSQHPG